MSKVEADGYKCRSPIVRQYLLSCELVAYITFLISHIGVEQTLHEKAIYTTVAQNTTLNDGAFKVSTQISGSTDCGENKKMST